MSRPTISVLCNTAHPGPLVSEVLGALRGAVDEIVVAADARVDAADLSCYAEVADILLRHEHEGASRHWPWLAAQASCDWILLVDGDELVSEALMAALPELVVDRRVNQYSLPIRWPWPTAKLRLAAEPWESDRRLRLLRNGPGLFFPARKHQLAAADPPIRYIDELAVYHLDLLLPDLARREAKVEHYDAQLFGLVTPEGMPFNEAYYLPESRKGKPATVSVPPGDAARIARALAAERSGSPGFDFGSVPFFDREQVAWYAPRSTLPEDAYRASVRLVHPLPPFVAQRPDHTVWVEVTNEGTARWPGGELHEPLIRLGVGWQPVDGGPRQDVGRTVIPHALDPGQKALVPVAVPGPAEAGPVELVIDVLHELVRWFDDPFLAQVEVAPSAEQRLAALTESEGPLVSVEAALRERASVGGQNGLVRQDSLAITPKDPEIVRIVASLAVDDSSVDAGLIDRLTELVRGDELSGVVEFGSGTSTVVLAALLAARYSDGPRLVSFETDAVSVERSRATLGELGFDQIATVVHLPPGERENGMPGFLVPDEANAILTRIDPQLVLVDGPPLHSSALRARAVEIVAPHLREDAALLMDEALRDAELSLAAAWQRRDDVTVHGIRPTPKGLLEATLRAPGERPRRGRLSSLLARRGS